MKVKGNIECTFIKTNNSQLVLFTSRSQWPNKQNSKYLKERRSSQILVSPVCSDHASLATCMLSNMATAAPGRRVNIKEARQRVASGFQPFCGMSYVLSGIARLTPVFPNQSSAHIARGSARDGGINRAKNSKYLNNFLFR